MTSVPSGRCIKRQIQNVKTERERKTGGNIFKNTWIIASSVVIALNNMPGGQVNIPTKGGALNRYDIIRESHVSQWQGAQPGPSMRQLGKSTLNYTPGALSQPRINTVTTWTHHQSI